MLLCIGLIMLTRLDYDIAMKQFLIAAGAIGLSFIVPVLIRKFKFFSEWRTLYAVVGIVSLGAVVVAGRVSYGAVSYTHLNPYHGEDLKMMVADRDQVSEIIRL